MTHEPKITWLVNLFETKAGRIALFIWRPGKGIKVYMMISLVITCLAPLKAGTTGKKSPVQLVQDFKSFQLYIIVIFFLNAEKKPKLFVRFHTWICIQKLFIYHAIITFYLWHKPKDKDYQT